MLEYKHVQNYLPSTKAKSRNTFQVLVDLPELADLLIVNLRNQVFSNLVNLTTKSYQKCIEV